MTPKRGVVVLLAILLGVLLAVGAWSAYQPPTSFSDDDYIATAISQPQIFHPTPGGGTHVQATSVEHRGNTVIVHVTSDGQRFSVYIEATTDKVTRVVRE